MKTNKHNQLVNNVIGDYKAMKQNIVTRIVNTLSTSDQTEATRLKEFLAGARHMQLLIRERRWDEAEERFEKLEAPTGLSEATMELCTELMLTLDAALTHGPDFDRDESEAAAEAVYNFVAHGVQFDEGALYDLAEPIQEFLLNAVRAQRLMHRRKWDMAERIFFRMQAPVGYGDRFSHWCGEILGSLDAGLMHGPSLED